MTSITHDNTPWFNVDADGTDYLRARLDMSEVRRPVLHHFSTLTPVQYRQLSGHLLSFGFDIIDNPGESNASQDETTLTVRKHATTTPDSVASTRRTLDAAVQKLGGRYDSWSTYIVVASRRQIRREKLESMRDRVPPPRRRSTSS